MNISIHKTVVHLSLTRREWKALGQTLNREEKDPHWRELTLEDLADQVARAWRAEAEATATREKIETDARRSVRIGELSPTGREILSFLRARFAQRRAGVFKEAELVPHIGLADLPSASGAHIVR